MLSEVENNILFSKTAMADVTGHITSWFIQYKCTCKYHRNYVSIFCKGIDLKENLILFC